MIEASFTNPISGLAGAEPIVQSLGVTYQIGAVLLVGCLGGKNAGALSQIAYLTLGLTPWFPVFSQGGGWAYVTQPTFGYLLGFIPGAWVCGWFAFRSRCQLERLGISCLAGLGLIHITGLLYVLLLRLPRETLLNLIQTYSVQALPGQLTIGCAVTVLAYLIRQILFY